ncbi:hotdog family protein [Nocardioides terrisoli]|uniref:acyl dehydratase n=1 Tax=Nocardioides terrisoli TaxID=3388267 RepID=UPI00287B98D1|nr:acyl dehydratase [Nocardioides marmorisolisilvae]
MSRAVSVRYGDQVSTFQKLEHARREPSNVQLFRYCAVTWNAHRIHYDAAYAATEGYPNVLVQSHLHGAFITSYCTDWMGQAGRLERLEYSVRRYACPGDVLTCRGEVTGSEPDARPGYQRITLKVSEVRESDEVECAIGEATIILPRRPEV